MRFFSASDRSLLGRWVWSIDWYLLTAILMLAGLGLWLVVSASPAVAVRNDYTPFYFVTRQIVFLLPALGALLVTSLLPAKAIWRIASALLPCALLLVIFTLIHGEEIKGATRWIGILGFSIQPSEFMKPLLVITTAWLFARYTAQDKPLNLFLGIAIFFICIGFLVLQPDVGMTILLCFTFGVQFFLLGIPLRYVIGLLGGLTALSPILYFTFGHVRTRVDSFLNPESSDTYQIDKAIAAFQNGGFFGTGPGAGVVKLSLPDAHSDFIFAVAAEELGLWFILALLLLYGFITLRGFWLLRQSNSVFAMLAGGGLLTMLALQGLIHMGANLALIPAKGMTLPFISYGGSSLISVGLSYGVVLALTRGRRDRLGLSEDTSE